MSSSVSSPECPVFFYDGLEEVAKQLHDKEKALQCREKAVKVREVEKSRERSRKWRSMTVINCGRKNLRRVARKGSLEGPQNAPYGERDRRP